VLRGGLALSREDIPDIATLDSDQSVTEVDHLVATRSEKATRPEPPAVALAHLSHVFTRR
jgi:hypothetical protein